MTKDYVIEMRNITKIFGEFVANDHINLNVRRGDIHALLGENGAGKSRLTRICLQAYWSLQAVRLSLMVRK